MTRTVRLACAADMPQVYEVRHEVFVLGQDVPEDLERDELDEGADHAVALDDEGRVLGTGRLVAPDGQVGTVGRMAVLERARGTGTGAAVLGVLEQRARERGLQALELHAQVHAQGFYERLGYQPRGEHYLEAGIVHVTMVKQLPGQVTEQMDQR